MHVIQLNWMMVLHADYNKHRTIIELYNCACLLLFLHRRYEFFGINRNANHWIILQVIYCTSLNWSFDGSTLFSGYNDGVIRVWGIGRY